MARGRTAGMCRYGRTLSLRRVGQRCALLLFAVIAQWQWSTFVHAQTSGPQNEPGRVDFDTKTKIEAEKTAEQAIDREQIEGKDVTFEQILADPDNIELNYLYAETQIRNGDVISASATLERILLIDPNLPRVRLLYAIVQYRLENLAEAQKELESVRELEMPDSLRLEIDQYLYQIQQKRKRLRMSAYVSLGGGYDTNRNGSPSSGQVLILDTPFDVSGSAAQGDDWNVQGVTRFDAVYDLGFQARHELFGSLTGYAQQQKQLGQYDIRSGSVEFGGNYDLTPTTITPVVYDRRLSLARQNYLHVTGMRLRATTQVMSGVAGYVEGVGEDQKYRNISTDQFGRERSGPQWEFAVGSELVLNPEMRLSVEYRYLLKQAREKYNAYIENGYSISHTWLLGGGQFLLSTFSYQHDVYDDPDLLVSPTTERDQLYRFRVTYGVPVNAVMGSESTTIGAALSGVNLTGTFEYFREGSKITNYAYTNRKYSLAFSKRWEF